MSQPAGDLVIDLSLDAARFDEQMARVHRHFSSLEADARKTASTVEQGLSCKMASESIAVWHSNRS
ncbi:phage tail tape measure protein [Escherichia coli]